MLTLLTTRGFEKHVPNGRRYWRWTPLVRKLGAYAAPVAARLRDLAPYAVMVLVVPGGSFIAPLLWLHRRQKRIPVFTRCD